MHSTWLWYGSAIAAACIIYACRAMVQRNESGNSKAQVKVEADPNQTVRPELDWLKELYFKLHNLERFYDEILPKVAPILYNLISEALDDALHREDHGITSIETYSQEALEKFLENEHYACMQSWEKYSLRRQAGGSRELFVDSEAASNSIRRFAPLRLVDGAWLSYVNKISTPITQRQVMQQVWQILSEELGDGELCKNHVHVYRKLVDDTSGSCPEPHSPLFIDPQHGMTDVHVWRAAVAQLLISILPEKFMPEILGFNLCFEGITVETLVTARELDELGYNPMYYLLHVSIDNDHSGHSAIAREAVVGYLDSVKRESGAEDLQVAWNRIRAGYILSEYLTATTSKLQNPPAPNLNQREQSVIKIIVGKARAGWRMHCESRVKIGGHPIDYWLCKDNLRERTRQKQFLHALANTGSLVRRGFSEKSKLLKDMSWGGKMFGSFTELEITAIKQWIDALPQHEDATYWAFTRQRSDDIPYDPRTSTLCWAAAFYVPTPLISHALLNSPSRTPSFGTRSATMSCFTNRRPNLPKLLPLWFASLSLLENFVSIPSKAANSSTCALLRVLRAQNGLGIETNYVGGLDEALRVDRVDLVDIGLHLMECAGLRRIGGEGEGIVGLLLGPDAEFAREMVALAVRPDGLAEVLVGLSCAFVELHEAVLPFVALEMRGQLKQIARRERAGLEEWVAGIRGEGPVKERFCRAYSVGMELVEGGFEEV